MAKAIATTKLIYLLCCSFLLLSCSKISPADEALYQNHIRLNRLLGDEHLELTPPLISAVSPLPSAADKTPPLKEIRYSMTEIWQYRECGLTLRMGERNSILGKVMTASQQLIYETQLLSTLELCLKQQQSNEQIKWLKTLRQTKQQQLASVWQKVLWSDPIIRGLFKPPSQRHLPRRGRSTAIEGLSRLNEQMHQTLTFAQQLDQSFEQILYQLQGNHYLGQLAIDSENTLAWLAITNALLRVKLPEVTCIDNKPSPAAKRLKGYLRGYYATTVQPVVSQLLRELQEVKPLLHPLYGDTDVSNTIGLLTSDDGYYQRIKTAAKHQQQTWQKLFHRCGLSLQP
ncbi:DUF3080 family protein [Corallincola luteus]|uniref:DUF3080 family protein n=1 Tax=Corallincola luteus TaxID=1775177 RepID=A0ABY2AIK8_9GAMM|nr:DUF3080 family protein [Corallincola luteus]